MTNSISRLVALVLFALLLATSQCQSSNPEVSAPAKLDVNLEAPPATLDPVLAVDEPAINLINQLFIGLTRYDPATSRAIPHFAQEWDVSQDGRTYTFELREDVVWVDSAGDEVAPVTADDVVYSIRRACDPATNSPLVEELFIIEDCETAYTATGIVDLEGIGVRAVDEYTVEFTLSEPAAYFPLLMTTAVARPQPRRVIDANPNTWTASDNILTNGPYLLTEQSEQRITLEQNAHYYDAGNVQIARVDVQITQSASQAGAMYQNNKLDTTRLPPAEVEQLQTPEGQPVEAIRVAEPCTIILGFTNTKAPLDNRDVRLALSQAVPREVIVSDLLPAAGIPAHHFAPPGIFGAPSAEEMGVFYAPNQAQDLLAQAGYPDGQGFPQITLAHASGATSTGIAEEVATSWQRVLDIDVNVVSHDGNTLAQTVNETTPLEEMPHVWQYEWCASSLDQHMWLYEAFHCEGSSNPLRRLCGTFDTLLEQAAAEQSPEERKDLYLQAEAQLALEEAAYVPLYHRATDIVTKSWLQRDYPILGGWNIDQWRLDMAGKEAADRQ